MGALPKYEFDRTLAHVTTRGDINDNKTRDALDPSKFLKLPTDASGPYNCV
jgi:hypothetical protein